MGKFAVKGPFPGWNRQLFVHIRTVCVCVCVCGKRSDDVLVWFESEKTKNFSGVFYCICFSSYFVITATFHMRWSSTLLRLVCMVCAFMYLGVLQV